MGWPNTANWATGHANSLLGVWRPFYAGGTAGGRCVGTGDASGVAAQLHGTKQERRRHPSYALRMVATGEMGARQSAGIFPRRLPMRMQVLASPHHQRLLGAAVLWLFAGGCLAAEHPGAGAHRTARLDAGVLAARGAAGRVAGAGAGAAAPVAGAVRGARRRRSGSRRGLALMAVAGKPLAGALLSARCRPGACAPSGAGTPA